MLKSVSPSAARKLQIIGAIILPIGAVLLVIGLINLNQANSMEVGFDIESFEAMVDAQMAASGLMVAGMFGTFISLVFLIIGSVRRSMSAGVAIVVPSTIDSPVPTIEAPVRQEIEKDQPAMAAAIAVPANQATPVSTKVCPLCGTPNSKDAQRCTSCTELL